jgi:SPP1 family predicted phage head-tail adaptor
MDAGRLRHRITIQERDGAEWVDFAQAWAEKEDRTGQENFENGEQLLQERVVIRFRIRYRAGVTHEMRVLWDSRAFDIQRVEDPDNQRREMRLLCLDVPYDGG